MTVERFLKFQVLLTSLWDRFRRKIQGKDENSGALRMLAIAGEEGKIRGTVF